MTYPTFEEIENEVLKTWNRTATYFNIMYDKSVKEANDYANQFTTVELEYIQAMIKLIQQEGVEQVRQSMLNGELEFYKHEPTMH